MATQLTPVTFASPGSVIVGSSSSPLVFGGPSASSTAPILIASPGAASASPILYSGVTSTNASPMQWTTGTGETVFLPRLPAWAYEPEPSEIGIEPETLFKRGSTVGSASSPFGSVREYVPSGAPRVQTTRKTVPCALQLKEVEDKNAKTTLKETCRDEFDAITGQRTQICTFVPTRPAKKLEYQQLECDTEETRALEGYKVEQRVIQDGETQVQNVVTPQIGVVRRVVGEPRPVGKPLPVQRLITPEQFAVEQALERASPDVLQSVAEAEVPGAPVAVAAPAPRPRSRASSRSRSRSPRRRASRSRSRSSAGGSAAPATVRSGGAAGMVDSAGRRWERRGGQYYLVNPALTAPAGVYSYGSVPYDAYSSSGFVVRPSTTTTTSNAPVFLVGPNADLSSLGAYDASSGVLFSEDTYGVGSGPLGMSYGLIQQRGFPFTFRHKPLSLTEYPSYWRWLAATNNELQGSIGVYWHTADEKTDTIATLESFILAGVWRAVNASPKPYAINAGKLMRGGAPYRNVMSVEFAALAAGATLAPTQLLPGGLLVQTIDQSNSFSIGWRAKSIDDAKDVDKTKVYDAVTKMFDTVSTAAAGQGLDASVAPTVSLNAEDKKSFGVVESCLLALLARIQYFGKKGVNMNKNDGKITLELQTKDILDKPSIGTTPQLLEYLRAFSTFDKTAELFVALPNLAVLTGSTASSYPSSYLTTTSAPSFVQSPRTVSSTYFAPPNVRYFNYAGSSNVIMPSANGGTNNGPSAQLDVGGCAACKEDAAAGLKARAAAGASRPNPPIAPNAFARAQHEAKGPGAWSLFGMRAGGAASAAQKTDTKLASADVASKPSAVASKQSAGASKPNPKPIAKLTAGKAPVHVAVKVPLGPVVGKTKSAPSAAAPSAAPKPARSGGCAP